MSVTISEPDIKEHGDKPVAIANKGFPYEQLADHRRFEELIYSIYKQEIYGGSWADRFDKIQLLQGVRERGRDCILLSNGKVAGLIQCKHSSIKNARATRPECVREILKFLLHSIIDPKILPDSEKFTYYFSVSYGFAEPALVLFSDFQNEIKKETSIEEWVADIITANVELGALNFENVKDGLYSALHSIVFETIIPQDLDLLLGRTANQNIIPLFFEVKGVSIEPEAFRHVIKEELRKVTEYSELSSIPVNVLLNNFKHASAYLRDYKNQLEGLESSYIDRPQVNEILQWIISPLQYSEKKEDTHLPIALLSGNAGVGKTVIMTELLQALEGKGIPTLGLKADKIYIKSVNELGEKLDLGDHIINVIQSIKQTRDKVVILVDQLDALSVSVSINTEYLDTFNRLIRRLIELEGVRVIVSCRVYDLNYDNELRFYKNQKVFSVGLLEKEQVLKVLTRLNISSEWVQPSLIELLRTVHHLNVFCRVYNTSDISINEIRSLNDLYNCLWKDKVLLVPQGSNVTSEKCKELLFEVSDRMSKDQQIIVQVEQYRDRFIYELEYLKSNHILIESEGELQFFHQTLFDYVFARRFIESNRTVRQYIFEHHQALHIRSALRMIMNFLKERNPKKYINVCKEILFNDKIWWRLVGKEYRVHIKLLIIESLGNSKDIDVDETVIGTKLISDPSSKRPFLDAIDSKDWIQFCIDHKVLQALVVPQKTKKSFWPWNAIASSKSEKEAEDDLNLCYRFLIKHINREPDIILKFLISSLSFEHKGRLVARVLYYLKTWNEASCELFNLFKEDIYPDKHFLYGILEKAASYDIEWVIGHYSNIVSKKIEEYSDPLDKPDFSYDDERLFTSLFQVNAEKAFEFYVGIVKTLSLKTKVIYDGQVIWSDYVFHMFDYADQRNSHDVTRILHLLIDEARKLSEKKSAVFQNFVVDSINSDSETFLMLLMQSLAAKPEAYPAEFYKLTFILKGKHFFETEDKLQYSWRKILKDVYSSFSEKEQETIINLILSLKFSRELRVFTNENKKYHYLYQYGQTKYHYLQALPDAVFDTNIKVKRLYQELNRKFPDSSDYQRPRMGGGMVGPPLEINAYEKMDLVNWEHSFRKYDAHYKASIWTLKGSMLEHGRAFESEVQKRPNYFFPFIEKIIDDSSVDKSYAIHGMQGLKSARFNSLEFRRLLKKLIAFDLDRNNTLYTIWLTDLLIDTQTIDLDIIQYLCDKAVSHPDPEINKQNHDALMDGVNTVRGAAASRLPYLTNAEHKDYIFSTIKKVTEDEIINVRVALMPRLAILMNLDEQETLNVFLNVTKTLIPEVYRQTPWSASYLAQKHFDKMKQYFQNVIEVEEVLPEVATILGVAWFNNKKGSRKMLKSILRKSSEAKGKMVDLALHFVLDPKKSNKAKKLYRKFLSETDQNIVNEYSTGFLHLDEDKFQLYLPLLKEYCESRVASKSPHYFFEYLLKCTKRFPRECLFLISNFSKYEKPNITESGHYDNEPIKVLVGAYNSLRNGNQLNRHYIKKTMKLFDKMLIDERFRMTAEKILIEVEA